MLGPFDAISRSDLAVPHNRKWSAFPDAIGAWVAEMDFGTAPEVTAALHDAVDRGHLGYLTPATNERLARAIAAWYRREHLWDLDGSQVRPVADVMSGFAVALARSRPGSAVIVPTPAYMPLLTFPQQLGRDVIEVRSRPGPDGRWVDDLEAIERAFERGAETLVLCNPHNPTGRVSTREELLALAAIVERHGGRVFADEVHAPLLYGGARHIPYASLSAATAAHTITAISASKGWNLAGLKSAQLIFSSHADLASFDATPSPLHGASTLGVVASTVAYESGQEWLDGTLDYLSESRARLGVLLAEELPEVAYSAPESTYLAWLDCSRLALGESPAQFFLREAGVALTDGAQCGRGFDDYARLVFAMPRHLLDLTIRQMGAAVRRHARAITPPVTDRRSHVSSGDRLLPL